MAKITISPLAGGYNLSKINSALVSLANELNNKVLYRDNPTGEPNSMQNDIDMNSNDLLNVDSCNVTSLKINGVDVVPSETYIALAQNITNVPAGTVSSINVQEAINELDIEKIHIVSNVSELQSITPTDDRSIFVASEDGGIFVGVTGASIGTYSNDGGSYCGTVRIPNGGDGSAAWVRLFEGSIRSARWYGALGDGVNDDTTAINTALATGYTIFLTDGSYRITAPLLVPDGGGLIGVNGCAGTYLNNDDTVIVRGGSRLLIEFGAGFVSTDYWNEAAVTLGDGAILHSINFWYPNQDIGASTPTAAYPPAIAIGYRSRGNSISEINLGNAYTGIDASRDHGNLLLDQIVGFPLYRGIRIASMVDNDYVRNVHFNAMRILYSPLGESWISPNIGSWVSSNGHAIELGRVTWSTFSSVFAYGYSKGVYLTDIAADVPNGINVGGSPQNCHFTNCGFDSCHRGIVADGYSGGIDIIGCNFAPQNVYNPTLAGSSAIDMENIGGTIKDVRVMSCKVWSTNESAFKFKNQTVKSIGNEIEILGEELSGVGILLDNCPRSIVTDNMINGQTTGNASKGISLINNCDYSIIANNIVRNLEDNPIDLDQTDFTRISGNTFSGNTVPGVTDRSTVKKYNNRVEGNIDVDYLLASYDNTDVDVAGLLTINIGSPIIRYTGTSTINGLTHGRDGETVTIRFSSACTVTDEDGATSQENRLFLAGNFSANFGDTLTLISSGSLGWYELSRSVN